MDRGQGFNPSMIGKIFRKVTGDDDPDSKINHYFAGKKRESETKITDNHVRRRDT